jgi:hypothetical protein
VTYRASHKFSSLPVEAPCNDEPLLSAVSTAQNWELSAVSTAQNWELSAVSTAQNWELSAVSTAQNCDQTAEELGVRQLSAKNFDTEFHNTTPNTVAAYTRSETDGLRWRSNLCFVKKAENVRKK